MLEVKIKCGKCGKPIEYGWQQKSLSITLIPHPCECETITIPDRVIAAVKLILAELDRAMTIHTAWPASIVRQAAFLAEEAGECIRAANRVEDDKIGTIDQCITEAVQTGAMAIRLIVANTIE